MEISTQTEVWRGGVNYRSNERGRSHALPGYYLPYLATSRSERTCTHTHKHTNILTRPKGINTRIYRKIIYMRMNYAPKKDISFLDKFIFK